MNHRPPHAEADLTVDGTGLLCISLLVRLRAAIADAKPGTIVHVIATDLAAPIDLPAWCHLAGHTYLGELPATGHPRYALQVSQQPTPTEDHSPWRPTGP